MLKKQGALILFPFLFVAYEMAVCLNNDAYLPALPSVMRDLATTHHLVQLTLSMWFLGYALLQLFIGPIADRFGRRGTLFVGSVVTIIATIGCALSQTIYQLLFFRLLQGLMVGMMSIPGYATVHELYEPNEAIKKIALMKSIFILAPAFGPLFGSLILTITNWRWIFGITTIWIVLTNIGLLFTMPETCPTSKRQPLHITNTLTKYKNILCNSHFVILTIASCCLYGAMIAWITAGPFLVISTFNYSTVWFGLFQCFIFAAFIVGAKLTRTLLDKHGAATIVKNTISFTFLCSVIALVSSIFIHNLQLLIIYMAIISATAGACCPILGRKAIESSKESMGLSVTISGFFTAIFGSAVSATISAFYNEKIISLVAVLFALIIMSYLLCIKSIRFSVFKDKEV